MVDGFINEAITIVLICRHARVSHDLGGIFRLLELELLDQLGLMGDL